jgi:hypothetical protein
MAIFGGLIAGLGLAGLVYMGLGASGLVEPYLFAGLGLGLGGGMLLASSYHD